MDVYIPLLVALLLLSAFFSSAETAFLTLERVRLEHSVREGVAGAARVAQLLDSPRRLLSAILLGNNLANTAAAAVGTAIAAEVVSGGSAVIAATLIVTALLLVFGEVGPKSIALHHNLALTRLYGPPLAVWARLTAPVVAILDALSRALLALAGERGDDRRSLNLGELRTAIRMGGEAGVIEADESSMLLRALALQTEQVRRIMTPRVDMVVAEADESLATISQRIAAAGYLRLPVFSGSNDNIVGYVHVSDLNAAYAKDQSDITARDLMREASFESERASLARVLEGMQQSGDHLVILVDEFGATAGLVTLEDVLEEVVGQIRSESGPQRGEVDVRIGGLLYVEGRRPLSELSEQLGIDVTDPDADSAAGLLLAHLRHMPVRGETITHQGVRFTVMGSDERRVTLVAVEPEDLEAAGGDEQDNHDADTG